MLRKEDGYAEEGVWEVDLGGGAGGYGCAVEGYAGYGICLLWNSQSYGILRAMVSRTSHSKKGAACFEKSSMPTCARSKVAKRKSAGEDSAGEDSMGDDSRGGHSMGSY